MKITFLGTGPTDVVPEKKNGRTNSSLYVEIENYSFIIDCSDSFSKQVKRENISKIDFILQTHAHRDAMGGLANQLEGWMEDNDIDKMPLYCEKECWDKITERYEDTDHIETHFIENYEIFKPERKLEVTPFRIKHSIQEGFPTVGFRFNDIVYSEDVGKIPEDSEKYYEEAKIIIFDAAMWFDDYIKGHQNVNMALEKAKEYHPEKFILTQAGHTYPHQKEAEDKIKEYWDEMKGRVKTEIILAYDGLTISLNKRSSNRISALKITQNYLNRILN